MDSAGNKRWKLWEGWDAGGGPEELSQREEEEEPWGQREQPVQRLRGKASWNIRGEEYWAWLPFEGKRPTVKWKCILFRELSEENAFFSGALNYFCCRVTAFNLHLFLLWWLKLNTYFSICFFFFLSACRVTSFLTKMALCLALRSCLGSRLKATGDLECPGQGMTHSKQAPCKCSYSSHKRLCVSRICVFCSFFSVVYDLTILRLLWPQVLKVLSLITRSFSVAFTVSSNKTFK